MTKPKSRDQWKVRQPKPDRWRFERKVLRGAPGECWPWQGQVNVKGYGKATLYVGRGLPHRVVYAHRLAMAYHLGIEIDTVPVVMHRACDNPPCCNPAHLELGTLAANNADMKAKWRHEHGSGHHNAKLNEQSVAKILERSKDGVTQTRLAKDFGVHQSTIQGIVSGRSWPHVPR